MLPYFSLLAHPQLQFADQLFDTTLLVILDTILVILADERLAFVQQT
jgi:hypothetical protein